MRLHLIPLFLGALLAVGACNRQSEVDRAAFRMLGDARFALRYQHYAEARDSIYALRKKYPTAIEARRQAILLLDSIELMGARDSLQHAEGAEWERLHVKSQFFERKLKEDLNKQ